MFASTVSGRPFSPIPCEGRIDEYERLEQLRVFQRKVLGDHPSHRQPDEHGLPEREVAEETFEIGDEGFDRVRAVRRSARDAVTGEIRSDHLIGAR